MIMATVEDGLSWYLSFSVWDFTLGRILNNAKAHYTLARLRGFHFLPQFHVSGVWSYIITQFLTYRERNHLLFGKYQKLLPVWEPVVESGPNNLHLFITSLSMKNTSMVFGWFSFKGVTAIKPAQWVIRPSGPWNSPKSIFIIPGYNRMTVVA